MKFLKIIGQISDDRLKSIEKKMSKIIFSLGSQYTPKNANEVLFDGIEIAGDPLIFNIIYSSPHILVCDGSIGTAATDGKSFYWEARFLEKTSLTGIRITCGHESWHSNNMHPKRRGHRNKKLWNWVVDYIVNAIVLDDLNYRKENSGIPMFKKHMTGTPMPLDILQEFLKDPWTPIKGYEHISKPYSAQEKAILKALENKKDKTNAELDELDKIHNIRKFYFADDNIPNELRLAETIYEKLKDLLPQCDCCGSLGKYDPPKEKTPPATNTPKLPPNQKQTNNSKTLDLNSLLKNPFDFSHNHDKSKSDQEGDSNSTQGGGSSPNDDASESESGEIPSEETAEEQSPTEGCSECKNKIDIFDLADTMDNHIECIEDADELAKKLSDAINNAKCQSGYIPKGLDKEIDRLFAPTIRFTDIISAQIRKSKDGNERNNHTRYKSRPLFAGILKPKKRNTFTNFLVLMDCSGSMLISDKTYGISQLQAIDKSSEGWLVPFDAEPYWNNKTKLKTCDIAELSKVKLTGGGGTVLHTTINEYKKHFEDIDFIVVITDGGFTDKDMKMMVNPHIPVYWITTRQYTFKPPFGKVLGLR